jgi:anaerobic selenocysteine-containing dehydrogenase
MSLSAADDRGSAAQLRVIYGACPHDCPDGCALETQVDEQGRAVSLRGRADHPITRGWLCAKVNRYLERVYHPERLRYPLRRSGPKGSGAFKRISWDEAFAEIGERWRQIIAGPGAQCILPYSYAGTLGLVNGAVTDSRFWNRLGASRLKRAICGYAAEEAIRLTIGARLAPSPEALVDSRLMLIWGSNPASTAPHVMPFLREAQRRGARLIVIDPLRTLTARSADLHVQPYPGTDAALALAMMQVIVTRGLHNQAWIDRHTLGWEQLRERIMQFPPERAAAITGLSVETISELALTYATTTPAMLRVTDGINRHTNGGQTVRTLLCLPAITGQYGIAGGGVMYSTSDWLQWDAEAVKHEHDPACPPAPRTLNMNRLGALLTGEADPPIYSLYVYNANPVASAPNAGQIVAGLLREDLFTVVHDLFETDTARYADLLLPATSQLEQTDLHKAYGHLALQYNAPAIAPLGEARSNWDVMRGLAREMGFNESWLQEDAVAVIRGVLEATAAHSPLLEGITLERLQAEGWLPLAVPEERRIPFADGRFGTPSGKVEFYSAQAAELSYDPLPGWVPDVESPFVVQEQNGSGAPPLVLVSPGAHHFISSSFANVATLRSKEGRPTVRIHPEDAAARGIGDGQLVRLHNERGSCLLYARISQEVRPGVLASPSVWWPRFSPDGRNINWLTSDRLADFNGGSTFHTTLVHIEPVEAGEARGGAAAACGD